MGNRVLFKKTLSRTTKFSLFFFIILITVLVITFLLIIILVRCSVVCCFPIIVFILVDNIFVVTIAIKSRKTCYKFTILPIIGINNKIFRYVRDWERKKTFNLFSIQAIKKVDGSQMSKCKVQSIDNILNWIPILSCYIIPNKMMWCTGQQLHLNQQ